MNKKLETKINEKILNLHTKVILNNNGILKGIFANKNNIHSTCEQYNVEIKLLDIESSIVTLDGKSIMKDIYYCEIDYKNLEIKYLNGFIYRIMEQSFKIDTKKRSDYQKKLNNY